MIDTLLSYWAFFGVGLAWLYAVGHSVSSHNVVSKLLLTALFAALGVIQLCWGLLRVGDINDYPVILYLHQPALFLIGPCLYCYSKVIGTGHIHHRWLWLHMIPALLSAGFSVAQYIYKEPGVPIALSAVWVALSGGIGAVYVALVLRRLLGINNPSRYIRVEIGVLIFLMLIGAGVAIAALFGALLESRTFFSVYLSLVTFVLVLSYWLGVRYPELVHYVAEATEARKYENSTLENVDVVAQVDTLERLMMEDHVYQDDTLSLASLAEQLDLTAHQLSELLNEHKKISFSAYIKQLRVAEAQRRLVLEPDEVILNIGLAVGFSSSSAFYSAFREVSGCPPGRFRKQQG